MRNAWRECADELTEAESAWFDGDNHEKYLAWVHKWTAFVRIGLEKTAVEVDAAQAEHIAKQNEARPPLS